jgi:NADP-dependent 3-hydroxy acid dehydrogenase YdfG
MVDLSGKVAVITGATSGIGLAVARELRGYGVDLVLTGRAGEKLNALKAELGAEILVGDIISPEVPSQLLDMTLGAYGRCDIVLNNAGTIEVGPIPTIDIDKVCSMVRTNVEAAYRVAYTFVRYFQAQQSGHLINISSVMGTKVRSTAGAYSGTKYAIEALSEALRMELAGTGVNVTCIEPGLVMTELHRDWPIHPAEGMGIKHPLQPEDVAQCVVFVLRQPAHVRIPRLMVLPSDHEI